LHAPEPRRRLGGGSRTHHNRELQTLGTVDSHDPYRIIVGLRQDGLDDSRTFGSLQSRPLEVVTKRSAGPRRRNARPGRRRSGHAATRRGTSRCRRRARARGARARRAPNSSLGVTHVRTWCSSRRARSASTTGWSAGSELGGIWRTSHFALVLHMELEEIVVAAPEEGRDRSALTERQLIAGIIDARSAISRSRTSRVAYTSELVSARYEMPSASSARSRNGSDVRAGNKMHTSPSWASRHVPEPPPPDPRPASARRLQFGSRRPRPRLHARAARRRAGLARGTRHPAARPPDHSARSAAGPRAGSSRAAIRRRAG